MGFEAPGPSDAQATNAYSALTISEDSSNERRRHTFIPTTILDNKMALSTQQILLGVYIRVRKKIHPCIYLSISLLPSFYFHFVRSFVFCKQIHLYLVRDQMG